MVNYRLLLFAVETDHSRIKRIYFVYLVEDFSISDIHLLRDSDMENVASIKWTIVCDGTLTFL